MKSDNVSALKESAGQQTLQEAFPKASHGWDPLGDRVLVQLRTPKLKTASGILLTAESKDQEKWMTSIGKIVALGPLAFRDRTTRKPWPEGIWAEVGDFIRCPKFGGDRWEVPLGREWDLDLVARFSVFRDTEIIAKLKDGENPLRFKDYL